MALTACVADAGCKAALIQFLDANPATKLHVTGDQSPVGIIIRGGIGGGLG